MNQQTLFKTGIERGAAFSKCRMFRYSLWRFWDRPAGAVAFIGLNPSKADEQRDDATLRRCMAFARDWGYGGLYMVNLFAFCATNPAEMLAAGDPVGPDNDVWLVTQTRRARIVVAAWGDDGAHRQRDQAVIRDVVTCELHHLGLTKQGFPRHPLRLPKTTLPIPWEQVNEGASCEQTEEPKQ